MNTTTLEILILFFFFRSGQTENEFLNDYESMDFRLRAMQTGIDALMLLTATKIDQGPRDAIRQAFLTCVESAESKNAYGHCILTAIRRRTRMRKLSRSRPFKKRKRETDELTASKRRTDIAYIADDLTAFFRQMKGKNLNPEEDMSSQQLLSSSGFINSSQYVADSDASTDFLSPKILSVFPNQGNRKPFLSPDILSFYEDGGRNNDLSLSMPALLEKATQTKSERDSWMRFILEATGIGDYARDLTTMTAEALKVVSYLTMNENGTTPLTPDSSLINNIFSLISKVQQERLHENGFALMNEDQLRLVAGDNNPDHLTDILSAYHRNGTDFDQEDIEDLMLTKMIQQLFKVQDYLEGNRKRRAVIFGQVAFNQVFSQGGVGNVFILSPGFITPAIFAYFILSPFVLSPFFVAPFVLSPFILAPGVLSPFGLSPSVLSPGVLSPFVLTPGILSPGVLSPIILSPYVLSPAILSPSVGSPVVLTPAVLSPAILSPSTLTAFVLSPGLLSPSILSPTDGVAVLSPCALCGKRRRRKRKREIHQSYRVKSSDF